MQPMNKWHKYGFESTPYSTDEIRGQGSEEALLVGRDRELEVILENLSSGTQLLALEGDFGVGKSSLAAVASYKATQWIHDKGQIFLTTATDKPLELTSTNTVEEFEKRVYYRVAASLLKVADQLISDGFKLQGLDPFKSWLQSPGAMSWSVGIGASILGTGGNLDFSKQVTPTSSPGFSDAGVIELIDSWLSEVFGSGGAMICVLDNLESLENSGSGINVFLSLRDSLFKRKHFAWIVCGAQGMVRVAFSSGKMSGVFQEPLDISPLGTEHVPQVIATRGQALRLREDAVLPVSPESFGRLYSQVGSNLRFALMQAHSYSMTTSAEEILEMNEDSRDENFNHYMIREGERVVEQLPKKLSPQDWNVLRVLVQDKSGLCGPGEYMDFGYKTMPSLLARVESLVKAGVVDYTADEDDGRRRIISATNNGRLAMLAQPEFTARS